MLPWSLSFLGLACIAALFGYVVPIEIGGVDGMFRIIAVVFAAAGGCLLVGWVTQQALGGRNAP